LRLSSFLRSSNAEGGTPATPGVTSSQASQIQLLSEDIHNLLGPLILSEADIFSGGDEEEDFILDKEELLWNSDSD
jgi:hypothetical protein